MNIKKIVPGKAIAALVTKEKTSKFIKTFEAFIACAAFVIMTALTVKAQTPTVVVNGDTISASNAANVFWLQAGSTLAKGNKVVSVSVLEFNLVPITGGGNDLQFEKVVIVSAQQTVPLLKAWKIESVLLDKTVSTISGGSGADNLGNHTATQDLDMAKNSIINLASPVDSTDAVNAKTIQNGTLVYAPDAGANDDYALTLSTVIAAYSPGMVLHFKANTANTGAATLNVNSLGAKTIKKNYSADLADNDILAGQVVTVIYDGTNFQMLSPVSNSGSYSPPAITFTVSTSLSAGQDVISCPTTGNTTASPVTVYCNFASGTQTNVLLSVSGLPGNVTASILPAGGIPNFTSLLTFTATGAAAGNYTITVTGTSGTNTANTTFTLRIGKRRVFVTSTTYSVGGGVSAIDGYCQARGNAASLGGIFKGYFGTSIRAPYSVVMDGPYELVNGNSVANNRADFYDGSIVNAINNTELNGTYNGQVAACSRWYGSSRWSSGGELENCGEFNNSSGSIMTMGNSNSTWSDWCDCSCGPNCSGTFHFYCFEQ